MAPSYERLCISETAKCLRDNVMAAVRTTNEVTAEKLTTQGFLSDEQSGYAQGCLTMADVVLRFLDSYVLDE